MWRSAMLLLLLLLLTASPPMELGLRALQHGGAGDH
jgi:hypothetical protein